MAVQKRSLNMIQRIIRVKLFFIFVYLLSNSFTQQTITMKMMTLMMTMWN